MKFSIKIILFAFLLISGSCNKIDNENISELDFIPVESIKLVNINDLDNTKKILEKNQLLLNLYPNSKLVLSNLSLLSNNYTKKGVLSLSPFSKDEITYTFISKVNVTDSIFNKDNYNKTYQNFDIYSEDFFDKKIYKTIIDNFYISSDNDIVLKISYEIIKQIIKKLILSC